MQIKVAVDARELANRPAGKGQLLAQVLWQWLQQGEIEPYLYVQPGQQATVQALFENKLKVQEVAGRGIFWQLNLARQTKQDGCQVAFAALSYLTAIFQKIPTLTVVHDLAIFFGRGIRHNQRSQWTEKISLRWSMWASAAITTISQSTKRDLCRVVPSIEAKIKVAPLASIIVQPTKVIPRSKRRPVILFVGTLEPRKGVDNLLKAFAGLPESLQAGYQLQLIGKVGWGGQNYPQQAQSLGIANQVVWSGYQSNQEVEQAYREAILVVYPSRYEGFGLPVAESLAAGTPVITSDNSALPEAGGKAAIYVETDAVSSLTKAMQKMLTDADLWQKQAMLGFEIAKQRSWLEVANRITQQLRQIS